VRILWTPHAGAGLFGLPGCVRVEVEPGDGSAGDPYGHAGHRVHSMAPARRQPDADPAANEDGCGRVNGVAGVCRAGIGEEPVGDGGQRREHGIDRVPELDEAVARCGARAGFPVDLRVHAVADPEVRRTRRPPAGAPAILRRSRSAMKRSEASLVPSA